MRKFLRSVFLVLSSPFRFIYWILKSIFNWISELFARFRDLFVEEPEEVPLPDVLSKAVTHPMSIFEHINALRKHIFRALIFMVITTAISFTYINPLMDWIAQPIGGIQSLQAIEVTEPIGVVMRISLLSGFTLALPYIIMEFWLFIAPGVKKRSRFIGFITIPVAVLLFLAGMAFAYFVMMPTALPFLINFMDIPTAVRPASYIRFVTGLLFWIGLAFEFPLIIFALAGMRIIKPQQLASQWRIAIVIIAVLSAAITPTIDPVNMGLVMGPMILLYFISIGLAYIAYRREPG